MKNSPLKKKKNVKIKSSTGQRVVFVCERHVEMSSSIINAHTGTLPSFLPEGNVVVQNTFTAHPVPALPDIPFAVEQTAQEASESVYI